MFKSIVIVRMKFMLNRRTIVHSLKFINLVTRGYYNTHIANWNVPLDTLYYRPQYVLQAYHAVLHSITGPYGI